MDYLLQNETPDWRIPMVPVSTDYGTTALRKGAMVKNGQPVLPPGVLLTPGQPLTSKTRRFHARAFGCAACRRCRAGLMARTYGGRRVASPSAGEKERAGSYSTGRPPDHSPATRLKALIGVRQG